MVNDSLYYLDNNRVHESELLVLEPKKMELSTTDCFLCLNHSTQHLFHIHLFYVSTTCISRILLLSNRRCKDVEVI